MNEKLAELQRMLEKSGVPMNLWPRIIEREKYRLLRNERADDLEWQQHVDKLVAADELEKKKEADFYRWVVFLLWLLDLSSKNAVSFFHESFRSMDDRDARPHPSLGEQDMVERNLAAIALCKFSRTEVEQALHTGVPAFERADRFNRGDVTKTLPMQPAIKALAEPVCNTPSNTTQSAASNGPVPAEIAGTALDSTQPGYWETPAGNIANPSF